MDSTNVARWEQQRRVPVRARGAEDGGGAAGPSTVKGKTEMVKFFKGMKCFSLPPHAGRGDVPKGASLDLGGGVDSLFSVVLCWQNFKICECLFAMPSFQCIGGGSVPPPMACQTLGRVARRKARHLALAEAPILFFLSYCVGKTLKSVNVCLQCPVFNALGAAVCHPRCLARRWAGRHAERRVAWPWRRRRIFFLCRIVLAKR